MKKIFLSLFLPSILVLASFEAVWAQVPFSENLKEYNIRLISNEQGVSTFSGVNQGIQLKIIAENERIVKMVLMFDADDGGAKRSAYAMECINIISNLMPQKIKSLTEAQDMLYKKMAAMETEHGRDVFIYDGLRFECNSNNGMMNIRITE